MALLITKNFNLHGLSSDQLYIRTNLLLDFDGSRINCRMVPFYSKELWKEDPGLNALRIPRLFDELHLIYDSSVNGDLLTHVHTELKNILSTDTTDDVPVLDPSTGEMQYDPSTGILITENVITVPKFADASEIAIVDLD